MAPSPYWPPYLHLSFAALLAGLFLFVRWEARKRTASAAATTTHHVFRGALALVAAALLLYPLLYGPGEGLRALLDGGLAGLVGGTAYGVGVVGWGRRSNVPRTLTLWGAGFLLAAFGLYFAFQETWTEARRSEAAQAAKEAAWARDEAMSEPEAAAAARRVEDRHKRRVAGALMGAIGAIALLVAAAWLHDRVLRRVGGPARQSQNVVRTSVTLGLALAVSLLGIAFMIPRAAGPPRAAATIAEQLRTLARAERKFRDDDVNRNGLADYWAADVATLFRMSPLLPEPIAQSDGFPLGDPPARFKATPILEWRRPFGHYFAAVPQDGDGRAYAEDADGDGLAFESRRGFAFCAYPESHGRTGRFTYLINENEIVWKKDAGGLRVTRWPKDPAADGWRRVE